MRAFAETPSNLRVDCKEVADAIDRAERTPSTRRYTTQARAARAKAELEELEREQMKELREAKKDQLRRQKADEIAAMRAALKAQAQQRAAKRAAERRTQGHGPHEDVALGRAQTRMVPEQASTVAGRRGRTTSDGRGPVPRPRALPPQLRRVAHFR